MYLITLIYFVLYFISDYCAQDGLCDTNHLGFKSDIYGSHKISVLFLDGQVSEKFFREDYRYIQTFDSFYKMHSVGTTWLRAKTMCALEGGSLFYPDNENEAREVISALTNSNDSFEWFYVGMSSFLAKNVYDTVEGKQIKDVFNNWSTVEPIELDGYRCVGLVRNNITYNINNEKCNLKLRFICRKRRSTLKWDYTCDMPDSNYAFNPHTGTCYKFQKLPLSWPNAYAACRGENSYLAVINNPSEASYLAQLWKYSQEFDITNQTVHLGFHNRFNEGWTTLKGTSLQDSGYVSWSQDHPTGKAQCGAMLDNEKLTDVDCKTKSAFICEHDVNHIKHNTTTTTAVEGSVTSRPSVIKSFRMDYTYMEQTEAFYKIHAIRNTWSGAKKVCSLEGAYLFYPENDNEAQAVISSFLDTNLTAQVFVGMSDMLSEGDFETIDGRSIADVYANWDDGEPNDVNEHEDCVIMRQKGTLNDENCNAKLKFICKKSLLSLKWDHNCNMPNLGYTFNEQIGKCYKVHTTPLLWSEADAECRAEHSTLAVVKSQAQSDYLVSLIALNISIHVGPTPGLGNTCCYMNYAGFRMRDESCYLKAFFVCEHGVNRSTDKTEATTVTHSTITPRTTELPYSTPRTTELPYSTPRTTEYPYRTHTTAYPYRTTTTMSPSTTMRYRPN